MYLTRTEYDRGVNTFSPEGRLFQVEYAIEAVKLGSTAIGVRTTDGVLLAVEKRVTSVLLEPSSVVKILEIDSHIGCAVSGLIGDARTLVDHARVEAQHHTFTYDEPIAVEAVTQSVCDLALGFGEGGQNKNEKKKKMSRPFGVAMLIAGYDADKGPQLFFSDPSGTFLEYKGKAIGSGSEGAQITLQEKYTDTLTLAQGQGLLLELLKMVMEENKLTSDNIEMCSVTAGPEGKGHFHIYGADELNEIIQQHA